MRYLAFAHYTYYPSGGMDDCIGGFDNLKDAKAAADSRANDRDYGQVYEIGADHFWWRTYEDGMGVRPDSEWQKSEIGL